MNAPGLDSAKRPFLHSPLSRFVGSLRGGAVVVPALLLLILLAPEAGFCWKGVVVDGASGAPIPGAVVVRSWARESATPAGQVHSLAGVAEAVSDAQGRFAADRPAMGFALPLLSHTSEERSIVYRAGYAPLFTDERPDRVALTRLPTSPPVRRKALESLQQELNVELIEKAERLREATVREWEFLNSSIVTIVAAAPGKVHRVAVAAPPGAAPPPVARPERPGTEDVSGLIRTLREGREPSERMRAAQMLSLSREPQAIGALLAALEDPDAQVRVFASTSLSHLGSAGTEALVGALQSPSARTRISASAVLAGTKDPAAVEPLVAALHDGAWEVRAGAARGLGGLKAAEAAPSLLPLLADPEAKVQEAAEGALCAIGPPAVSLLLGAVDDPNPLMREHVARALGKSKDSRALAPLAGALKDADPKVAVYAANALGDLGDPGAVAPLLEALSQEQRPNVRGAVIGALGKLRDPRAVVPLIALLERSETANAAENALVAIGAPAAEPVMARFAEADPRLRARLSQLIGRLRGAGALSAEAPLPALKDPDVRVRAQAVKSLEMAKDPRSIEPLLGLWTDPAAQVREAAAHSLVRQGEAALGPVMARLKAPDPYLRWRAVWAIGEILGLPVAARPGSAPAGTPKEANPAAQAALVEALGDGAPEVRWSAIHALGRIQRREAAVPLLPLLSDPDEGLRAEAQWALTLMTGETEIHDAAGWQQWLETH